MPESNIKFLGIEIGGTKLQLSVVNSSGVIEENFHYTINAAAGAAGIQTQISEGLKKLSTYDNIAATGVGFGGPVNWKTGCVQVSHQVSGWNNFNIKEWLEELTQKPAFVENDANAAALAEAVYGRGEKFERVFYMTIGSGIGGGMVVNGDIYHGKAPGEVEIGHICLDKKGTTLESQCSGWAVNKKIKTYIQKHPDSLMAKMAKDNSEPEAVFLKPALEQKDAAAKKITEGIADDLSFALSHVVHLFHPDVIIIGGGLSLLEDHLQKAVSERLSNYVMKAFLPPPPVQIAALGRLVVPLGAAELAKRYWAKIEKNSY